MKQLFSYMVILLLLSCNSQSKMGKVKYGKDGVIESGSGITKCTPPAKRYTKSLDAVVKGSFDSLSKYPKGNLEIGVKNTVTRLSDYSSEGLDIDLILFRVCEMANNRGLSADQTDTLLRRAIDAWGQKKSTSSISITNNGVNNGLMAGVVLVPESADITFKDNFVVTPSAFGEKLAWEVKPKKGSWMVPYIAYLKDEDSLVKGSIISRGGTSMGSGGTGTIKTKDGMYDVIYKTNIGNPANQFTGNLFICSEKPSILFFGDLNDPRKQYLIKL